jgi:hypothetical protein
MFRGPGRKGGLGKVLECRNQHLTRKRMAAYDTGVHRSNSRLQSGLEGSNVCDLGKENHVEFLRVTPSSTPPPLQHTTQSH